MTIGPVRVVVVDGDTTARSGLRALLAHDAGVVVAAECGEGPTAVDTVRAHGPDVLFLSLRTPRLDAAALLAAIPASSACAMVLVGDRSEDAALAFDLAAVDFLLKPFTSERLARALERARASLRQHVAKQLALRLATVLEADRARAGQVGAGRILVRDRSGEHVVPLDAVDWIGAQDYYAEIHAGGATHLVREPLARLESALDPARFVRIHRNAIVNVARIRTARPDHRRPAVIVLADGTELRVSQARRRQVGLLLAGQ